MKKTKILLTILLCAIISLSACVTAFATNSNPAITVSNVTAAEGESVTIDIDISNNPGIMAMAFCITYDSDALEYVADSCVMDASYSKSSLTCKNHADKGHVSISFVENKDNTNNGKLMSLSFVVKKDARGGIHPITLANSNREKHGTKLHNSFSNSKQDYIVPKVISGGVTVPETCENSGHKLGEWNIVKEATCTELGLKERSCIRCGISEDVDIPFAHDFESEWTIDKAATPTEDGIMSRHCKNCNEVTDIITFSYEEIEDDNDNSSESSSDNEQSSDVSSNTSSNDTSSSKDASNSNNSTSSEKPNIDNVVGEKVPQKEAEKFEEYQNLPKPDINETDSSTTDTSSQDNTSSEIIQSNSDVTTGIIENSSSVTSSTEPSFFATPAGIVTAIVCLILSVGIIAIGILLIIKNKKQ